MKVTRTLITIRGRRFKRINGFAWGYGSCWITALATPEECAAWDAEQATKAKLAERARKAEEEKRQQERDLEGLFACEASAKIEPDFSITIQLFELTKAQVRRAAEALKEKSDGR